MFVMASRREAEVKIQNDWPVWLYLTDYYSPVLYDQSIPVKGLFLFAAVNKKK